jgi:hypothetical protein
MGGGYASKLGIYYSKDKRKYVFSEKYGKTPEEAFEKIRTDIIELIEEGKNKNIKALNKNDIPAMLKGKILATYYPNLYLNVFSKKYLLHYIIKLNLDSDSDKLKTKSLVELREVLLKFKNNNKYMKEWSIYEFGVFLNDYVGHPNRKKLPSGLIEHSEIDFPLIEEVDPIQITLQIDDLPEEDNGSESNSVKRKRNFEKGKRNAKRIGDRGEELVKKYEISKLKKINKPELAKKVDRISLKSDSYGYDILSFEPDGREKQIEVKATIADPGKTFFVISENELKKSKELSNYYLYIVFNANKTKPGIWELKNPFINDAGKIKIEAKSHYVSINSSIK